MNKLLMPAIIVVLLGALAGIGLFNALFFLGPKSALDTPNDLLVNIMDAGKGALIPGDASAKKNPVSAGPETLASAKKIYESRCVVCHGTDGKANTTIGSRIFPRAADLTASRTQGKSDGSLYWLIENGLPHTGMPGWKTVLKEDEIWQVVAYLRALPNGIPAVSVAPAPLATAASTSIPATALSTQVPATSAAGNSTNTPGALTPAPTLATVRVGNTVTVTIQDYSFNPAVITVSVGTTVVWVNQDDDDHSVTSTSDPKVFEFDTLAKGKPYSFVLTQPGSFPYICTFHDSMHGLVVVK